MSLETVPCDLCGGKDFRPLYPGNIPNPDLHPETYYSSSRTRAGYLPIVRCTHCGLMMTNPRDDLQTIQHIYASLNDPVYDTEDANRLRTARAYLRWMHQFVPDKGKLLDVGCATGVFACEAHAQGWQVTGLEASALSFQQAKNRCDQVTWHNQLLEEADFQPGSFHVITLWDVLEHVYSPTQVMLLLKQWLMPGGWLFLNLPNSASLTARLSGPRWVLLLREHFWFFAPETMRALFDKTGFTLLQYQPNYVHFSFANIAKRLGQYPGLVGQLGRKLAQADRMKTISLTFPIGEMNVAAKVR